MSQPAIWGAPRKADAPVTPEDAYDRVDNSFDALLSSHSGASRPSYALAGTVWHDTDDFLRHYNGVNDLKIITENAAGKVALDSLIVDTDTLVVDEVNGRVGIGTDNPARGPLHLHKDAGSAELHMTNGNTGEASGDGFTIFMGENPSSDGVGIWYREAGPLRFATNGSEAMRLTADGFVKASNTGNYLGSSAAYHEFSSDVAGSSTFHVIATAAAFTAAVHWARSDRSASSLYDLMSLRSQGDDVEFRVRGDGQVTADGSFTGGGADYAEWFEWLDDNPDNEDRAGISVVLEGNRVRPALDGEVPMGVVSTRPAVVGDGDIGRWKDKYLRDDFGRYIFEPYSQVEWIDVATEEVQEQAFDEREVTETIIEVVDGVEIQKTVTKTVKDLLLDEITVIDETGKPVMEDYVSGRTKATKTKAAKSIISQRPLIHREPRMVTVTKEVKGEHHSYQMDQIPEDVTAPADATITAHDDNGMALERRKLNPDYDPSFEYVSREDRQEWVTIGLMGKLRIYKGQPVDPRWIKMRDVSAEVEEWLVR